MDQREKATEIRGAGVSLPGELQMEGMLSPLSGLQTHRPAERTLREHSHPRQSSCVAVPTIVGIEGGLGAEGDEWVCSQHTPPHRVLGEPTQASLSSEEHSQHAAPTYARPPQKQGRWCANDEHPSPQSGAGMGHGGECCPEALEASLPQIKEKVLLGWGEGTEA